MDKNIACREVESTKPISCSTAVLFPSLLPSLHDHLHLLLLRPGTQLTGDLVGRDHRLLTHVGIRPWTRQLVGCCGGRKEQDKTRRRLEIRQFIHIYPMQSFNDLRRNYVHGLRGIRRVFYLVQILTHFFFFFDVFTVLNNSPSLHFHSISSPSCHQMRVSLRERV